jgi:hypothetical protein
MKQRDTVMKHNWGKRKQPFKLNLRPSDAL